MNNLETLFQEIQKEMDRELNELKRTMYIILICLFTVMTVAYNYYIYLHEQPKVYNTYLKIVPKEGPPAPEESNPPTPQSI